MTWLWRQWRSRAGWLRGNDDAAVCAEVDIDVRRGDVRDSGREAAEQVADNARASDLPALSDEVMAG